MSQLTSRRAFLGVTAFREDSNLVRPPGSVVPGFADQCGDSVEAYPEGAIAIGQDGYPVFQPTEGSCTFCGTCPNDVLDIERLQDWPWRASVEAASCLSVNGVSCRVCQDNCEQNAISFRLQPGGRADPSLDPNACTGCGSCTASCPVNALTLTRQLPSQTETSP